LTFEFDDTFQHINKLSSFVGLFENNPGSLNFNTGLAAREVTHECLDGLFRGFLERTNAVLKYPLTRIAKLDLKVGLLHPPPQCFWGNADRLRCRLDRRMCQERTDGSFALPVLF